MNRLTEVKTSKELEEFPEISGRMLGCGPECPEERGTQAGVPPLPRDLRNKQAGFAPSAMVG